MDDVPSASQSVSDLGAASLPHYLARLRPIQFRRATTSRSFDFDIDLQDDADTKSSTIAAGMEAKDFYQSVISSPGTSSDNVCIEQQRSGTRFAVNRTNKRGKTRPTAQLTDKQRAKLPNKLLQGAHHGDLRQVKDALRDGCDINVTDEFSWTALMCASHSGHTDVVKYLLRKDASWSDSDKKGRTALTLARMAGHGAICDILKGASPDQVRSRHQELSKKETYTCEICKAEFKETPKSDHESSTIHLFNCQHKPQSTRYYLPESNVGFQMLVKDGWNKEHGLGPSGKGMKFPVKTVLKRDRHGLGADAGDPKARPRVTHFKPYDVSAVKKPKKDQSSNEKKMRANTLSKKSRKKAASKEKAWEIGFRQSFNVLD